jgi:hypothetical protein
MRTLVAVLAVLLFPALAYAQDAKPAHLADYVSLCLAMWSDAPDLESRASALGLQNAATAAGARITVGKSTLEVYRSAQTNPVFGTQTIIAATTTFADGRDLSCDVNFSTPVERADIDTMAQALHLDGQILTFGQVTMGRWVMPGKRPPVLIRALLPKNNFTMNVQELDTSIGNAAAKH